MRRYQSKTPCLIFVFWAFIFLAACGNDNPQTGVAARVEGSPIFLEDVRQGYHANFFEWSSPLPPSLQEMQNIYGRVLVDLILIELIRAELEAVNSGITREEILEVENKIRQDYPEGEFEKKLIEEYIDIEYWRTLIGHKLLWDKFTDKILMPGISVELDEIQDYYYSNIEDYYIPVRLEYLYLESNDRQLLEKALDELENFESLERLRDEFSNNIFIVRHEMRVDQLPLSLAEDLKTLDENQAGNVWEEALTGYYALYLIERKQEKLLKPHQVYNIIEKNILDAKLARAFGGWLSEASRHSRIEINSGLLGHLTGSAD